VGDADVEFLYWEDCPSHERALAMLRSQMAELAIDESRLTVTRIDTDNEAAAAGFPGSPTIRVRGVDVQDPGDVPSGLTCRLYRLRDGRPSPLPDPADVHDVLTALAATAGR
jgi:hypothetical protein